MKILSSIQLPKALYLHTYEIVYVAQHPLELVPHPHELAAVFRGALHQATTLRFCRQPNPSGHRCKGCRCLYGQIFEPKATAHHQHARKFKDAPPAYTITVVQSKRQYQIGEELKFHISIFGRVNKILPDFIRLCQQVTATFPKNHPYSFQLKAIRELAHDDSHQSQLLYSEGIMQPVFLLHRKQVIMDDSPIHIPHAVRLHFSTLCNLFDKGEQVLLPSLSFLIKRIWERAWLLNSFYGDGAYPEEQPNWQPLFDSAPAPLPENLEISYWRKKRTRRKAHTMATPPRETILGFKGSLQYRLRPEEAFLIPILQLGAHLQLGKLTVFGLGKYTLSYARKRKRHLRKSKILTTQ